MDDNYLVVNNSEKGVAIFDLSHELGNPIYKGSLLNDGNVVASEVMFGEGNLFISNMGKGKEKKCLYMFTFDEKSSIDDVEDSRSVRGVVYDIAGRKVTDVFNPKTLSQGLYIVNGKKIAVK